MGGGLRRGKEGGAPRPLRLIADSDRRAGTVSGLLALVSVSVCFSAPNPVPVSTAVTQTTPKPDASPWWEQWRYSADVTLPARPGSYIAGARADFTRLLTDVQASAAFAPDSVRVAEILPGGRVGEALASRFERGPDFDAATHASGLVLWRVSPSEFPGWERTFRVFFDTVDSSPKPRFRTALTEKAPTLLLNGSFERGEGTRLPGGWTLKKRWGCRRVEVRMSAPTHAILLHPGQRGWAASLRTPGTPGLAIDPGRRYRLSFRYAIQRADPRALLVAAFWYDTSRALLKQEPVALLTRATSGWKPCRLELSPPRDSAFLAVELSTQCHEGRILVDDLTLFQDKVPELTAAARVRPSGPAGAEGTQP